MDGKPEEAIANTEAQQEALKSAKKKVKAKPDKYHAALKGKMASVGMSLIEDVDQHSDKCSFAAGIAGQKGKVKVAGRLLKPLLGRQLHH